MKRLVSIGCIILLTVVLSNLPAHAGPFGFEGGMSLAQIEKLVGKEKIEKVDSEESPNLYYVIEVPSPHPNFRVIGLIIDEELGLVCIVTVSKPIETSVFGTELMENYSLIRDQLKLKYGDFEEFDFLKSGSIWTERQDWMMSLELKERILKSYWKKGNYGSGIEVITLEGNAENKNSGVLVLRYFFKGIDTHLEKNKRKKSNSL